MLHLVVATHGPENCTAAHPEVRKKFQSRATKRRDEVAKALGITIQGAWTNMPGHTIYFLLDAPHAHAVHQMLTDLHIMDWNTVVVNPVIKLEEALEKIKHQK